MLSTATKAPWGPDKTSPGYIGLTVKEAFRRIHREIDLFYLPPERGLINANNGVDDGDVFRIAGIEKEYPNLVMVPESVGHFEFSGFTLADHSPVGFTGWSSLEPYLLGMVTGWKYYEFNTTSNSHVAKTSSPKLLLGLLRDRKIDVMLLERWMAQELAQLYNVKIRRIIPSFPSMPMYIYLNKKHASLVPEVSAALVSMKRDGSLQRIHDLTLGVYLK